MWIERVTRSYIFLSIRSNCIWIISNPKGQKEINRHTVGPVHTQRPTPPHTHTHTHTKNHIRAHKAPSDHTHHNQKKAKSHTTSPHSEVEATITVELQNKNSKLAIHHQSLHATIYCKTKPTHCTTTVHLCFDHANSHQAQQIHGRIKSPSQQPASLCFDRASPHCRLAHILQYILFHLFLLKNSWEKWNLLALKAWGWVEVVEGLLNPNCIMVKLLYKAENQLALNLFCL